MEFKQQFSSREEITTYLGQMFKGLYTGEPRAPALHGGRSASLAQLEAFKAKNYGRRNHTNAPVSRLSAYLRHGQLSMLEVAEYIRSHSQGRERDEFLKQLTWRDFFYLVLEQKGLKVLENLEEPKYPMRWVQPMPDDILEARTNLPCVDAWVSKLVDTGYLHNHERLWFAAYTVHFRQIHWQAGFAFFREHLLDGDIASNALSWQWVASTFSHKPYFMNKDNISKFSSNQWCAGCRAKCPFDKTYQTLERELFGADYGWSS